METKISKAVLITGASTGIGRSCALYLDKLGFHVFAGVRRTTDAEGLKKISSERLIPVIIDVTHEDTIRSAMKFIEKEIKDYFSFALVNNAGIIKAGPVEFQPLAEIKQQMDVNFFGVYSVIQQFIPLLREYNGRIINISSISGKSSLPFMGAYSAAKSALEAISDSLRLELKPWNITVSNILPGDIQTPLWGKALSEADNMMTNWPRDAFQKYGPLVEMMKKITNETRGIHPDHVACAVADLLQSKNPKTRVLVGKDARLHLLLEKLPTQLRDRIVLSQLPKFGTE